MLKLAAGLVLFLPLAACECSKSAPGEVHAREAEQLKVVSLKYANAADVAAELGKVQKEAQLVADPRTNSLIVNARSAEALAKVLDLIASLDVAPPKAN